MAGGGVSARSREPLLEREQELVSLAALVDGAVAGEGRFVTIEGPAGVGKTRLAAEARRRGEEAGIRVLVARGGELEREFAFGVVRQLFEPSLVTAEARAGLLDGAAAPARAVFEAADGGASGDSDSSFAVLHGLFWLSVNLSAERPLLLVVDDLHWADRPSLRFLVYLARRLEGLPILAVCGLRPSEPGLDPALLVELAGTPHAVTLRPGPLGEAAVGELVRERLGDAAAPAFVAACREATAGNPLLLSELLKAVEAEGLSPDAAGVTRIGELGSRAISRAVLLRLAGLSGDALPVARALAVLGDGADLRTLAALSDLDDGRVAGVVDDLTRAEIVRLEPPLGFVHPLVSAAVYGDIPAGERALRHARAARLLADVEAAPERVAAHLLAVPPRADAAVVATLRRAASVSLARGAPDSAAAYLTRALAEPPAADERATVLAELGRAEAATSGPSAAAHLGEAYELLVDPRERGAVALTLALTLLFTGAGEESARLARTAAAELPPELADERRALEAIDYATAFFGVGDPDRLRELEPHRRAAAPDGVGAKSLAALASYDWAAAGGAADECARLALEALAGGDLTRVHNGILSVLPIGVLTAADRDEALDVLAQALAEAHARGSVAAVTSFRYWRGWTLYRRGDLLEAAQEFDAGLESGRGWGFALLGRIYRAALKTSLHVERGDLARAREVLMGFGDPGPAALRTLLGENGEAGVRADVVRLWLNARVELRVAEGRFEDALADARRIEAMFPRVVNPALGPWRSLAALALDRLGREEEAVALAAEELELARRWGAPWSLGRALRGLAAVDSSNRLELLEEAVAVLERSPARLELAKAHAALGSALRQARRPTDAREPLRRALELAERCGADALAEHARTELYASGSRPRRSALSGVESLTASEQRVAALAADGQTNRDIAQALFVTPKTVELHLTNAYRKLGIRSRRELPAALAPA